MEPSLLSELWLVILNKLGPFLAFFVGIVISAELKLYPDFTMRQQLLMGLPVALVVVTGQIHSATPGYTQDVLKFLALSGTIMFFGTLTPSLFSNLRGKISDGGKPE